MHFCRLLAPPPPPPPLLLLLLLLHGAGALRVSVYENGGGRDGTGAPLRRLEVRSDADVAALRKGEGGRRYDIYDARGDAVQSLRQLQQGGVAAAAAAAAAAGEVEEEEEEEVRVYQVPTEGHAQFIWPTGGKAGHRVENVAGLDRAVSLETLALRPRLFYVRSFLSSDEADVLRRAATDPRNPRSLRPSAVATTKGHEVADGVVSHHRTSQFAMVDGGYATDGAGDDVTGRVQRRAFRLLRVPYNLDLDGNVQVLRYQPRQAYHAHHDWFGIGTDGAHNRDPAAGGTNRLASVLVYLSNVTEGGQTVFPQAGSPLATEAGRDMATDTARAVLQPPGEVPTVASELFGEGSWEASMVRDCYSKLAVRPRQGDAVLFYNQGPGGTLEGDSEHGGCPVLQGEKWAANIWVWNGPIYERMRTGASRDEDEREQPGDERDDDEREDDAGDSGSEL